MPDRAEDLPNAVLTIVLVGLILSVGTFAASTLVDSAGSNQVQTAVLLDGSHDWNRLGNGVGTDETVYDSRGYGIALTGADDSYFQSVGSTRFASDDTWTVSAWGRADSGATGTRTLVSLEGRLVIVYDAGASNWTAWYYDEGARNSYLANVSASAQPSTWANIQVTRNASALAIYRNASRGEVVDVTQSQIAPDPDADNWDGRVDELRTFDTELNSSQRSAVHTNPIDPRPAENRTIRAMFDEPYSTYQLLLFTDTKLETSNATFESGLPGSVLSSGGLLSAGDYDWRDEGPQLRANDAGELDDAPVAYVDYGEKSSGMSFVQEWNAMVSMAGIALIVMLVATIVFYLQQAKAAR